ncbi:glycerophosphoryl diester phosphodiesterase membrane domain-containing protein [Companilactobacillus metriopterae]|uniref:glycerophosphoryl diester phosphodiesterase membrane domain-containing protein n=1 Tax=Companilactobacillus metriopterae TaxID=1909267 RepID=UPI0013E99223|nr:glycerophosphodiester phosphodiesterase [Companilactobacillus metriopterae]
MKVFIRDLRSFFGNTFRYAKNIVLVNILIFLVIIPMLASSIEWTFKHEGIVDFFSLFLSFSVHPFYSILIIVLMLLMLFMIIYEFIFLFLGVFLLQKNYQLPETYLLKRTFTETRRISFSSLLFLIFYFILIMPFSLIGYKTDLLSKVQIPVFILDYIFSNKYILVPVIILVYLVLIYIGYRLIFTVPLMIIKKMKLRDAIKTSKYLTKKWAKKILSYFIGFNIVIYLMTAILYFIIILIQGYVDKNFSSASLPVSMVSLLVIQAIKYIFTMISSLVFFYIISVVLYEFEPSIVEERYQLILKKTKRSGISKFVFYTLATVLSLVLLTGTVTYDYMYLSGQIVTNPEIISHRGVNGNNAVQNSINALNDTSTKVKPDYVEMDIQETKDKKFVVMHDNNLKALTGVNTTTHQLTLKQLQKLTVTENGKSSKVISFDDYLAAANKDNQKLLIEIKPNKADSKDMISIFIKKYSKGLLKRGDIIHSLSIDIVDELKTRDPKLTVGYIMPFNIVGPPKTKADFFTVEYTTLTSDFVTQAHDQKKKVYAWTVNDEDVLTRTMFYEVDGVITDSPEEIGKAAKETVKTNDYVVKLVNYMVIE